MVLNPRNFLLPLACLATLAACGGGGGSNEGSTPSNGLEMNSYLPAHADLEWEYSDGSYVVHYGTPRSEGNDSLDVRVYPTGGKDYFFTDTDTLAWRGFYSPSVSVSGAGEFTVDVLFDENFVLYETNQQAGESRSIYGSGTVDISPTYGERPLSVSGTSTFYGFEPIVVPYGAFDNALHIGFHVNVSVNIDGTTITLPRSIEYWLVEGIGVVYFIEEGQPFELSGLSGSDRDGDGLPDAIDEFPDEPLPPPARLLLVPDNGVALSKFDTVGKLSHTVDVLDSHGLTTTNWVASASEAWLEVTPSGTTVEDLVITANPALVSTGMHRATIQVSSPDSGIENTETINVGFWVGTADPQEISSVNIEYSEIASDPVRPYVYLHNGGADIDVYNVYDPSSVTTIYDVGTALGDMEVSQDGRWLYVANNNDNSVSIIDLDDTSIPPSNWTAAGDLTSGFTLTRTKGHQLLLSGHGVVYEAQSGVAYGAADYTHWYSEGDTYLDASLFGNRFCRLKGGLNPYDLACFDIDYDSSLDKVIITKIGEVPDGTGSFGQDIALSKDGSTAYVAASTPRQFTKIDVGSMSVTGSLDANASFVAAVETGPDDALHGATSDNPDMWVYEANGDLRKSTYVSGVSSALEVSGDGYISINLDSPKVSFVSSFGP